MTGTLKASLHPAITGGRDNSIAADKPTSSRTGESRKDNSAAVSSLQTNDITTGGAHSTESPDATPGTTILTSVNKESNDADQESLATTNYASAVLTASLRSGPVTINDATLSEGGTVVVDGGHLLSIGPSNVVYHVPRPQSTSTQTSWDPPTYTISVNDTVLGHKVFSATSVIGSSGQVVIGRVTMTPGAPPKAIDHYLMSLGTGGIMYKVPSPQTTNRSSTTSTDIIPLPSATEVATSASATEQSRASLRSDPGVAVQIMLCALLVCIGFFGHT